jgi:hypothetical protein
MKKYLIAVVSCFLLLSTLNGATNSIIRNTLTMLLQEPYSFKIKPVVKVIYKGTVYSFSPENATSEMGINRNVPMHYAAKGGDVGDLKTLVSWGADINAQNRFGETPLTWATRGGNFRALYYLIQNGAEITKSKKPFQDLNAFHAALLLPKKDKSGTPTVIKTVQALLQADTNRTHLNQTSRYGTPLEFAVKLQLDPRIIRFLIMQGAKVTRKVKKQLKKELYQPILKTLKTGELRSQMYTLH